MENYAFKRRSCRSYKKEQISNASLSKIMKAAQLAPSAMNEQGWFFVIIQKEDFISEIGKLATKSERDPYYGAPTLVVAFAKDDAIDGKIDTTLAIANMMYASCEEGLGTCWIHCTKDVFNDSNYSELKEACGVPSGYTCIGSIVIGIPNTEIADPKPRKEDVFSVIR